MNSLKYILIFGLIGVFAIASCSNLLHTETHTVTINDIERECTTTEDGTNCVDKVYAKENGEFVEFVNDDSFFYGKWKSGRISNLLREGGTFKIKTYGYRVYFLSMFPNIISVEHTDSIKP